MYFFIYPANAQVFVEGTIMDDSTQQVVPYVNIGIIALQTGTVSTPEGTFKLSYQQGTDTVTVSSIGYETQHLSVEDIIDNPIIRLVPRIYMGEEITVTAQSFGKLKVFGNKLKKKGGSIGYGNTELGTEIGALINLRKPTLIESAHFTVNFTGADSMRFRLNIYEFNGREVGENYLTENVLIYGPQSVGTFSVDLTDYNIIAEGEVLLSLEYVEAIELNDEGISGMMFRGRQVRKASQANLYMKYISLLPFEKQRYIHYKIGFYMMGRELQN